jgi:hypothetical protein
MLNYPPAVIYRKLREYDKNGNLRELQTVVEFTIVSMAGSIDPSKMQMDEAVAQGKTAIDQIKFFPSSLEHARGLVDDSFPVYNNIEPILVTWGPFLQKVEQLTVIVDKISEVRDTNFYNSAIKYLHLDPSLCQSRVEDTFRDLSGTYSQIVHSIDASDHIIKVVLAQKARDEALDHLVEVMNDAYSFVNEAAALKEIESHKQIIAVLTQQTIDCAYFIRDYAINKSFCMSIFIIQVPQGLQLSVMLGKRTVKNFISDTDVKIKQYEAKFQELNLAFQGRAILQTEITVLRILDNVDYIGE